MYVSKIAEQLKEYDKLQKLIDNIEQALIDLEPEEEIESTNGVFNTGGFIGCAVTFEADPNSAKQAVINSDVVNLMRDDIKTILCNQRDVLREQQLCLEV